MSDDRKPFSRPKGPKPPRGGKPERGQPAEGRGSAAKRPYRGKGPSQRRDDGEAATERPKRDFSKPRRDGQAEGGGAKPGRKPFEKRRDAPGGARLERAADQSKREDRPRKGGEKRPDRFDRARTEGRNNQKRRPPEDAPRQERQRAHSTDRTSGKPFPPRAVEGEKESGERIAKRLARAGISSRRDAEELIAAGRVKVNGKVLASPAFNVRPGDVIELDSAEIPAIERTRLFLFHKPAGVVTTTRDPQGRKTVFDILPKDLPRLMTVGRLDINTEGLLLLTNDGGLSRVLELPSTGWLRRYRVRVHGKVEAAALEGLKQGIAVDGVFYGAIEASLDREQGSNAWLTLGLREGKNREVKNVLGALGLEVSRLIRISYGPFQLGELPEGTVQELKGRTLRDQLGQRLVEESGANFSAPVATPFSNRPVHREREETPETAERPKIRRDGERGRIGEGGLIKNRKREREQKREDALGRLQTSRPEKPRGFKQDGGKPGARDKKRDEPQRSRSSNVWMAPGARPGGRKEESSGSPSPRPRREGQSGKPGPRKGPRGR